tara:strand:- start:8 stop:652 length:645 start_codon:yes stop_codon:yes gene_type:complete
MKEKLKFHMSKSNLLGLVFFLIFCAILFIIINYSRITEPLLSVLTFPLLIVLLFFIGGFILGIVGSKVFLDPEKRKLTILSYSYLLLIPLSALLSMMSFTVEEDIFILFISWIILTLISLIFFFKLNLIDSEESYSQILRNSFSFIIVYIFVHFNFVGITRAIEAIGRESYYASGLGFFVIQLLFITPGLILFSVVVLIIRFIRKRRNQKIQFH